VKRSTVLIYAVFLAIYLYFLGLDISTGFRRYAAYPASWISLAGAIAIMLGIVAGIVRWWIVPRLTRRELTEAILVIGSWLLVIPGFCLILFGDQMYLQARMAMERPAMERYLASEGDCPTVECRRDASGVVAFVHGENPIAWSGICHDPAGAIRSAEKAQDDRKPGADAPPRVFHAEVRQAIGLGKDWVGCGFMKLPPKPPSSAAQ
jgi:hypothetical protein